MRWTKAHATVAQVASGDVGVLDMVGNACADALAGRAATQAQVVSQDIMDILKCGGIAKVIQKRAVSILIHIAKGKKEGPTGKLQKKILENMSLDQKDIKHLLWISGAPTKIRSCRL